jgi:hypothetical protein
MRSKILVLSLFITSTLFFGCSKSNEKGSLSVNMTDAPGPYQQVNVEVLLVSVNVENSNGNSLWMNLPTHSGIYNLLDLQNGIDTNLVDIAQVPAGDIHQMRLLLGPNNTVMVDSVLYPMKVPSGTQSGIKVNGTIHVVPNSNTSILLDFDASKSVVQNGNGDYHLKPVIQVVE